MLSELLQRGDVHDETLQIAPRQHHRSAHVARPPPRDGVREAAARPGRGGGAEGASPEHRLPPARSRPPRPHEICGEAQVHRRRKLRRRQPHRPPPALGEGRAGPRQANDRSRAARRADDRRRLPRRAVLPNSTAKRSRPPAPRTAKSGRSTPTISAPTASTTSIDRYIANPRNRTFVLFDGDELAGMSSFLGIDEGRQVLEIGGTYYRPQLPRHRASIGGSRT